MSEVCYLCRDEDKITRRELGGWFCGECLNLHFSSSPVNLRRVEAPE